MVRKVVLDEGSFVMSLEYVKEASHEKMGRRIRGFQVEIVSTKILKNDEACSKNSKPNVAEV